MPLYLDIHRNVEDTSPEEVKRAHLADLQAQEQHGVSYLKYWVDERAGTICCLVEAPSVEACHAVHREAHGNTADQVIEVESNLIEAYLGHGDTDELGAVFQADGRPMSAFRTVVFTDIVGSTAATQARGDTAAMRLVRAHDTAVRAALEAAGGREVKHTGDGIMAAFFEATAAVNFASAVQRSLARHNADHPDDAVQVRIGMSAGEPIDENSDLFGATVQLAARVCDRAGPGEIVVANVVRELCIGKDIVFDDRGEAGLKGFPDPVRLHAVRWA
ncbi:MAG: nickel-binding protein [Planctomycetota bacterium]